MNLAERLKAAANYSYQTNLQHIDKAVILHDIGTRIAAYWGELVGQEVKPYVFDYKSIIIRVDMGHKMWDGKYPSKSIHLGLLREFADELLADHFKFDDFQVTHDNDSTDLQWGKDFWSHSVKIYATHGGDCTYKQVGTKMVEQPIYEMECN